jgi:hypothetical protein
VSESDAPPNAPGPGDPAPAPPVGRRAWLLLALLASGYAFLAVHSLLQKSVTIDELGHLPAGFYFLRGGDSRFSSLNPPLVNALNALPVVLMGPEPEVRVTATYEPGRDTFWGNGYRFMIQHATNYRTYYAVGRCVTVALVGALGVILFLWARALCPLRADLAGLLAAGLLWYSPGVLAHARLVTTDAGSALFITAALWSLHGFLRRPNDSRMLTCGLALGLAQLSKFYALFLYPVFIVVAAVWLRGWSRDDKRRAAWGVLGAFAVSLLVVNAGYLFQGSGAPLALFEFQSERMQTLASLLPAGLRVPLPGAFMVGLDAQMVETESGIPSFLWGETFSGGRWYYFLALIPIKTPIPLLLIAGIAVALAIRERPWTPRELVLLLFFPVSFFLMLSLADQRQLGMRALLTVAPLWWLWVAATLARTLSGLRQGTVVAVLLAWTVLETGLAHPDYLSYFNQTIGGSEKGYRYATGSNSDWGQDLVGLRRYQEQQGDEPLQLLYFGSVAPAIYDIDYVIPGTSLEPGLLAVSTTLYQRRYHMFERGRLRAVGPIDPVAAGLGDPVARIGDSIHVYRIPEGAPSQ